MSLPKYPEYKESGIDSLGAVPKHWSLERSDGVLVSTRRQIDPSQFAEEEVFHYSIPSVQEFGTGRVERGAEIASAKQLIDKKVVLVSKLNPRKATTCIAEPHGRLTLCSTEFVCLEPRKVSIEYLAYMVQGEGFRQALESKVMSVTNSHQRAEPADIYRFWMALPPQQEQLKISAFLDRETAKIDALVAEQEKLIELLEEKRQAVISHAVTKGLDPTVPTKDSGIEWLGKVPKHWEILKGSLIGTLFGSEPVSEEHICDDGEVAFIKVRSMSLDSFSIESWSWFIAPEFAALYQPRSDYIAFPKRGAAIFTNKVNIVERSTLIDPNLMGWKINKRALKKFVAYTLKTRGLHELADVSSVPQINNKHIGPARFPVPPIYEQEKIIEFLESKTAELSILTDEAQRAIALLQERRAALISAAVTGQLDVRQLEAA